MTRDEKAFTAVWSLIVAACLAGLATTNCATVGVPAQRDAGDAGWILAHVPAGFDAGTGALR